MNVLMYTIGVINRLDRNMNKTRDCVMLSTQQYPEGRTSRYSPVCMYGTLARQAVDELACLLNMLPHNKYSALKLQFGRRILTQRACVEAFSLLRLLQLAA